VGGNPIPGFLVGEGEDRIARPTKLEGPDFLEILAFAKQLSPDQSIQARTREDRGAVGIWFDARSGCLHIYKGRGLRHKRFLYSQHA
jgi:hypothetical protein